jgi:hypothetical protein
MSERDTRRRSPRTPSCLGQLACQRNNTKAPAVAGKRSVDALDADRGWHSSVGHKSYQAQFRGQANSSCLRYWDRLLRSCRNDMCGVGTEVRYPRTNAIGERSDRRDRACISRDPCIGNGPANGHKRFTWRFRSERLAMCRKHGALWYVAMAGALVADPTRRVDERPAVGTVSWRRSAVVLVRGDAHCVPDR